MTSRPGSASFDRARRTSTLRARLGKTMSRDVDDEVVAAWSKEQNRGVPPWECLDEQTRDWWRRIYANRHAVHDSYPSQVIEVEP